MTMLNLPHRFVSARLFAAVGTFVLGLFILATAHAATDAAELDRAFPRSSLQIATPDAKLHKFNIWVADSEPRRNRGLMFVKKLDAADGMLFVYERPQPVAMWMKNTYVSLDMLFVAADGKVIRVVENTEPHSLKTIESGGAAMGVIELAAGSAARLKITPGAQVIHPAFTARP